MVALIFLSSAFDLANFAGLCGKSYIFVIIARSVFMILKKKFADLCTCFYCLLFFAITSKCLINVLCYVTFCLDESI
jgi:hypothetical protein